MSIRNILVAYNGLPSSDAALQGAIAMQKQYDAHLTGLFAYGDSNLATRIQPWMPQKVRDALLETDDQSNQMIRDKFRESCTEISEAKRHWIENKGPVHRTLAAYARLYDITVLGMHEDAAYGQEHLEIHPERVTLESGRPVISFPAGQSAGLGGQHVVIAWDGGRAAARALADALQILDPSNTIEIVSVGRVPFAQTLPDFDVTQFFDRHGLSVKLTSLARDARTIAETLLDHCETVRAGLMVMGAYQHSPLREGLIGGVTQDIAARAKIPIFMSH
ncbi:MAG: universal stress protein [Pseudomonadota bacterium]